MPIDLELEAQLRKEGLDALLGEQRAIIPTQIAQRATDIGKSRGEFFSRTLSPLASSLAPTGLDLGALRGTTTTQSGLLERELGKKLGEQQLSMSRGNLDLVHQEAIRRAKETGLSLRSSQDYARQQVFDEANRSFLSSESAKDRALREQIDAIRASYEQRGLQQEIQYEPKTNYEQAMYKILGGLLGTGVGIYAGNKLYGEKTDELPSSYPKISDNYSYSPYKQIMQRSNSIDFPSLRGYK